MEERFNAVLSDPALMAQLAALAQSLGGERGGEPAAAREAPEPAAGCKDTAQTADAAALLTGLLGGTNGGAETLPGALLHEEKDENTALLLALRPFLRAERREMVDQLLQIARLSRAARVLLQILQGGDEHV